jgi:hypothetical protein
MQAALASWHAPKAAEQIAEHILQAVARSRAKVAKPAHRHNCRCGAHGPAKVLH